MINIHLLTSTSKEMVMTDYQGNLVKYGKFVPLDDHVKVIKELNDEIMRLNNDYLELRDNND